MNIESLLISAIIILISVTIHESAHAYAANALWDPTPKLQWRLNFSPLSHIDPIGFVALFLIGFGWWRPVIFNPSYFKNPIRDEALVAFAWPASNILLAVLWIFLQIIFSLYWNNIGLTSPAIAGFWQAFAFMNIWLALFNMLPIPPLDWYRLLLLFVPSSRKFFTNPQVQIFWLLAVVALMQLGWWKIISIAAVNIYRFIFTLVWWIFNF